MSEVVRGVEEQYQLSPRHPQEHEPWAWAWALAQEATDLSELPGASSLTYVASVLLLEKVMAQGFLQC